MAPPMQTILGSQLIRRKRRASIKMDKSIAVLYQAVMELRHTSHSMVEAYKKDGNKRMAKKASDLSEKLNAQSLLSEEMMSLINEFNNLPED